MVRSITCAHCGERIKSEETDKFIEVQPMTFMYDGDEVAYENMAWKVHTDCASEFVEGMGV